MTRDSLVSQNQVQRSQQMEQPVLSESTNVRTEYISTIQMSKRATVYRQWILQGLTSINMSVKAHNLQLHH